MNIDATSENLAKVAALLKTIATGKADGKVVGQPMRVAELIKTLGVERRSYYRWINGASMPLDSHLEAIASQLLHVSTKRLQEYFDDKVLLHDLFN